MPEQVFTSCTNEGPISVYVRDGKVVRIRPLQVDEKEFRPWTIEAGGKAYSPPKKFNIAPFIFTERDRLYSEDRIEYPMKRKDFDPKVCSYKALVSKELSFIEYLPENCVGCRKCVEKYPENFTVDEELKVHIRPIDQLNTQKLSDEFRVFHSPEEISIFISAM